MTIAAPTQMRELLETFARFTKDRECSNCRQDGDEPNPDCENHEPWDMPNDDAVETLHSVISQARELTILTEAPPCQNFAPSLGLNIQKALHAYAEAEFACGEWTSDNDETYETVSRRKELARARLEQAIAGALAHVHVQGFTPEQPDRAPLVVWTKPLTPVGPEHDPLVKLAGIVYILNTMFHVEAYEVHYPAPEWAQTGKQSEDETYLAEILNIVQGAANTVIIGDREYVLAITPGQR